MSLDDDSGASDERLLDAAASCYARFGLAKTTAEDVAREAGISRATLYRHFKNRDELLLAVVAREASRLAAEAEVYLQRFVARCWPCCSAPRTWVGRVAWC
jgi:AcrR family transcriptional regulator